MSTMPLSQAILHREGPVFVAECFELLDDHTAGMTHDARQAFLVSQIGHCRDETDTKGMAEDHETAWAIIKAWEAENARLDAYARASVERQWENA